MSGFLVAEHAIGIPDPDAPVIATGGWNADGTPKVKTNTRMIPPDASFPVAWLKGGAAEAAELVQMGAARWPDAELADALAKES